MIQSKCDRCKGSRKTVQNIELYERLLHCIVYTKHIKDEKRKNIEF